MTKLISPVMIYTTICQIGSWQRTSEIHARDLNNIRAIMNYLLLSTIVLFVACVASYSQAARDHLESICAYFSHEIGRVSSSVPKRLAFNLGLLLFFGFSCYGLFNLYGAIVCAEGPDGDTCDSVLHLAASGALSLVASFLMSKLVVKTFMIGKKLLSGRQRSQSMGHYWRDVFPHEQEQERMNVLKKDSGHYHHEFHQQASNHHHHQGHFH